MFLAKKSFFRNYCYSRLQICWTPTGEDLFACSFGGILHFERSSFSEKKKLTTPQTMGVCSFSLKRRFRRMSSDRKSCLNLQHNQFYFQEMFSIISISQDGAYLAASTLQGSICVWQVSNGEALSCSKYMRNRLPKIICSMFWHRKLDSTLFFVDTEVTSIQTYDINCKFSYIL